MTLQTNDQNHIDLPDDLLPVSRVIARALMCPNYNSIQQEQLIAYVREAQNLWQNQQDAKESHAYYLVAAYRDLEAQKVLSKEGRILRPSDFAKSDELNGFLCRPRGFAPIILQRTAEFVKLMNSPNAIRIYACGKEMA
ncbi:MAG: hypothetical protein J6Y85_04915 [Alphaproteobacteria bacterium]|nr:hypothetical protein [Alphaproteobacteria bacterium]